MTSFRGRVLALFGRPADPPQPLDAAIAAAYTVDLGRPDPLIRACRAARRRKGLSQAQVADQMGVSAHTVRAYEAGTRVPPLDKVRLYAAIVGVDMGPYDRPATRQE